MIPVLEGNSHKNPAGIHRDPGQNCADFVEWCISIVQSYDKTEKNEPHSVKIHNMYVFLTERLWYNTGAGREYGSG